MRIFLRYDPDYDDDRNNNETLALKAEIKSITGSDDLYNAVLKETMQSSNRIVWVFKDVVKLLKHGETSQEILNKLKEAWNK